MVHQAEIDQDQERPGLYYQEPSPKKARTPGYDQDHERPGSCQSSSLRKARTPESSGHPESDREREIKTLNYGNANRYDDQQAEKALTSVKKRQILELIHHGLVLISDGKGIGHPARLELSPDTLSIQIPLALGELNPDTSLQTVERAVAVRRQADGGFGFSIKGGASGSFKVPILISKVFKAPPSEDIEEQLFVGDAILQINNIDVTSKTHEEVVEILRQAPDEIHLKVKHQKSMAYFLRRGSTSSSGANTLSSRLMTEGSMRSGVFMNLQTQREQEIPKGWRTLAKLPLPMAYVTRYLMGTDKLRPNGFEVRAVDGTSSGIIHCEDPKVVEQWFSYISNNISRLNNKSIKLSNKFLHPDELIVYLGWVCEKLPEPPSHDFWQTWEPRFLILKGSDVCFFENPPLNTEDLNKCIVSYKVMETRFKDLKDEQRKDKRENVFMVETSASTTHYLSTESITQLLQLRGAWHRATYYSVNRIQTRTFACSVDGRPSGLVFDLRYGVGLYDIPSKKYLWKYKFSQLKQSSDDGKMRVRMTFRKMMKNGNNLSPDSNLRVVDIDCSEASSMVFCLHSFLLSRLLSVDPDFLELKPKPTQLIKDETISEKA